MDQFKLYRRYIQQNGHVAKTELIATIMPNHLQELIFEMAHYAEDASQNFSKLTCDQVQKIVYQDRLATGYKASGDFAPNTINCIEFYITDSNNKILPNIYLMFKHNNVFRKCILT